MLVVAPPPSGRRERNKRAKLERITAAAGALFAQHGVDDVTTQQIADAADVATGTLFLYARSKGELLLLVQNQHYAAALERGRVAADAAQGVLEAVLALVAPVVECNRAQVDNGRTYLREVVFGDPNEPHRAEALAISGRTERAVADVIARHTGASGGAAAELARVVSAVLLLAMAGAPAGAGSEEVLRAVGAQLAAVLPS